MISLQTILKERLANCLGPLAVASFLAIASTAMGQSESTDTVKTTMRLHPDGTQVTLTIDPNQHTREETVSDASGHLLKKTTWPLDDRNLALGAVHYDGKGKVTYKETYRRDASDHVVESAYTSGDGRSLGRTVYIFSGDKCTQFEDYDANGNRIVRPQTVSPGRPDKHRR